MRPVMKDDEQPVQPLAQTDHPRRRRMLVGLTIGLLVVGLVWLLAWIFYFQYHETTTDAYANGNLVNVNSPVAGSAVAFYADDTDLVIEGQLLVALDETDYRVRYEKELSTLAAVVLQVQQLYHTLLANQVIVESKRVELERACFDYENRLQLIDTMAVSNEDFIHARDAFLVAELALKQAEYQYQVSRDAAGNTSIECHPLIEQQKNAVRTAYYQLQHCSIYAPTTGFIAQRVVNVGQWVAPMAPLMSIVPSNYVWVDANFKETQLTHMRIGQSANVTFDLYGSGVKYEGKVIGIASGSGSVFSLIPAQNATGNWIKIVQRLAVRISLDPEQLKCYPTRLGISANVDVTTHDRSLPLLAELPASKPVATTQVFTIDYAPLNALMDEIICMQIVVPPTPTTIRLKEGNSG